MKDPIIIVGAGLSGLHAASILVSKGIECIVLEARGRIGGRVLSRPVPDKSEIGRFDLGPTWFWPQHEPSISGLVSDLGLRTFEQHTEGAILLEQSPNSPVQRYVLPNEAVARSIRLVGGAGSLVDAVAATLSSATIKLDTRVTAIQMDEKETVTVEAEHANGEKKKIRASAVILALPPRIAANHIEFSPPLSPEFMASLKDKTTWMAGQAKAVAVYHHPFWREDGLSGQAMSWSGPLQEIHDASPDNGYGALFGFFGMPAKVRQEMGEKRILERVASQLTRLFGPSAGNPIAILYRDWSSDPKTAVDEDTKPLTDFPDYGPLPSTGVRGGKVFFAGTETSAESGGHLEGALQSAERAALEVLRLYKNE